MSRCLMAGIGAALLLFATFLPATAQTGTPASACRPPSPTEAEVIARQYFDAFNTGDTDALDGLLAPDYVHHGAIVAEQDRELHKERVRITLAGFPDLRYTIDELMTDGNLVLVRHTMRGTHAGEYAGLAPTGTAVEVTGIHIHHIACGVITETWNEGDGLWLYQQLGLAPPPPAGATAVATPAAVISAASPASCADLTTAEIVEAWFEAGWERGDSAAIEALLADDHRHHWAIGPEATVGIAIVEERIASWRVAFPDLQVSVEGTLTDGDLVAMWWTATGTADGPFMDAPPTGAAVTFSGINIFRVSCGEVVEAWSEMSMLHLNRQLGLLPPTATPAT